MQEIVGAEDIRPDGAFEQCRLQAADVAHVDVGTGGVDRRVHATEGRPHGLVKGRHGLGVPQVDLECGGPIGAAKRLDQFFRPVAVAIPGDRDPRACAGQCLCDGAPEPSGAAGDRGRALLVTLCRERRHAASPFPLACS